MSLAAQTRRASIKSPKTEIAAVEAPFNRKVNVKFC